MAEATWYENFSAIIRALDRHAWREQPIAFNRLANIAFGRGAPKDAGRVRRLVQDPSLADYFEINLILGGDAGTVRVLWDAVTRDHPELLGLSTGSTEPWTEMLRALEDERHAVQRHQWLHPVELTEGRAPPDLQRHGRSPRVEYAFQVVGEDDDAALPFDEGTEVELQSGDRRWSATLLAQDPKARRLILRFSATDWPREGLARSNPAALIALLIARVKVIRDLPV